MNRPGPAIACIAIALVLAGCSTSAPADVAEDGDPSPEETVVEEPQNLLAEQPCSAFTGNELAAIFNVADLGPFTEADYYDGSGFPTCSWNLPPGGQERLGVSSDHQLDPNLTLIIGTYNDAGAIEGANVRHTGPEFVQQYVDSHQDQIGSNEIPIYLSDIGLGASESNGGVLLAVNDEYWAELTLWQVADHNIHLDLVDMARALTAKFE